jgi:hypothetical protein
MVNGHMCGGQVLLPATHALLPAVPPCYTLSFGLLPAPGQSKQEPQLKTIRLYAIYLPPAQPG